MPVGKNLFELYGRISMLGVKPLKKDLKAVDQQAKKLQRSINRMGRNIERVGKTLTKAFTLPLLAAAAASVKFVDDATDLNETIAKTGEIFGESAKEIEAWADTSATKIGQSKTQAMDAASTFAIFGKSAGLAGKELVTFSTEFVELASDMASFFNTKPEEAITAIGAALRGENEPIRRYGVLLDDATMRTKAFELGLVSSTKNALMPQTKVLAAQALIIEQTKTAQGDFARTSAGLANQKRILNAQVQNLSATIGQIFLPVAMKGIKVIQKLLWLVEKSVTWWKNLDVTTKRTIKGFVLLAAAIGPVAIVIGKMVAFSKILVPLLVALKTGTFGWAAAMAALQKSVMGVTLLVGALVALGWYWYSEWDKMKMALEAMWVSITYFIGNAVRSIDRTLNNALVSMIDAVSEFTKFVPGLAEKLDSAKVGLLKLNAASYKAQAAALAHKNAVQGQGQAAAGLGEKIEELVDKFKKLGDTKDEDTKKTQLQIEKDKEAAAAAKKAAEEAQQHANMVLDAEKKIQDEIAQMTLTKAELLQRERDEKIALAEQTGQDVYAIEELYALKEAELKEELRKEEERKEKQATKKRFAFVAGTAGKLSSVLDKLDSNRLARIDQESARKIEAVKKSTLSEEEKAKRIEEIEEQTDKKRRAIQRRAAIRNKIKALFDIAVNTVSAVVEALPNIPLSLLVGGLGAASAGVVAAEPLPALQEGAMIKGSAEGVIANIGENDTDEMVFPLERGIDLMADGFMEKLGGIERPAFEDLEPEGPAQNVTLKIGTFIGDKQGLKMLERKLDTIRISENQRKGI